VTVVEADVMAERRLHWMLVADRAPGPVVAINRPDNLGMRRRPGRWPWVRRTDGVLSLSPGPNPTVIRDAVWDRTLDLALAANPVRLVGDPSYVAGLARAALRRGVRPARLTAIELGHTYAWRVHRDVAARAFGVPIGVDYNTSELGSIAVTCRDGRLHLLEANALYEILDRGRAVTRAGAVGALVATTLDTALRPLLRYVVGDVVRFRASACTCGRPFRVIEYEGRLRDLIAARRGEPVTYRALDDAIGAPAGVAFFRVTVERDGAVLLELVASDGPEIDGEGPSPEQAVAALEQRFGRRVRVAWRRSLRVPPRGKLLSVRVDGDDGLAAWQRRFLGAVR
jgi:hypothetical protein